MVGQSVFYWTAQPCQQSPWHGQSLGYPTAESVLVPHGWHQRLKPHFVDAGLLGFQKSLAGLASNTYDEIHIPGSVGHCPSELHSCFLANLWKRDCLNVPGFHCKGSWLIQSCSTFTVVQFVLLILFCSFVFKCSSSLEGICMFLKETKLLSIWVIDYRYAPSISCEPVW